jgi:hypothetical protein
MSEGYGKWVAQAREHGLSLETPNVVRIVEAVAEFIADQQLPENGDIVIRVRIGAEGQVAIERLDARNFE